MIPTRTIRITPYSQGDDYWGRAWEYRELLLFLARRDLVVRYRQTMAGVLWLLAKPFSQVFIFTVLFSLLAGLPSDGLPYPVLVMSGVVLWEFFSSIVNQSTVALQNNTNLITKVSFPRILLPIGTIAPNLLDLFLNLLVLTLIMIWYGCCPSWRIVFLPVPIALISLVALGMGFWFSASSVHYRDFRQLAPFLLQFFYLLSPIAFTSSLVRERLPDWAQLVFYVNPLATAIDLFRWCTMPVGFAVPQHLSHLLVSLSAGILLVLSGQWFFRRLERTFADVL